ncbi:MAG TPA: hypothetical protein VK823_15430 [Streptosporangiaceae bacterium]|nr:hypothetical protein [Streptosporangiaceae bacterium]
MRSSIRRGLVMTAFAGTCVLAAGPIALAQATTSPEAFALDATGVISVPNVGDATLTGTPNVTAVNGAVDSLLQVAVAHDTVTSTPPGNSATSVLTSITTPATNILSGLDLPILGSLLGPAAGLLDAGAVSSSCTWDGTGTADADFTLSSSIANLEFLGTAVTIPGTLGTDVLLSSLIPSATYNTLVGNLVSLVGGLTSAAGIVIELNYVTPGPGTGTRTVSAVHIAITGAGSGLLSGATGTSNVETIDIASSTCGSGTSVVASPVAGGKGLGIGLGLLGLLGSGFAAVYLRRRHVALAA